MSLLSQCELIVYTNSTFDWECTFRNVVRVLLSVLFLVLYSCHTGAHSYTYMVMWTYNWEPLWSVSVLLSVLFQVLYSCHTGAHSYTYMVMWKYNCERLWSVSVETWLLLSLLINVIVVVDFGDILTKAISTIKKAVIGRWTLYFFKTRKKTNVLKVE